MTTEKEGKEKVISLREIVVIFASFVGSIWGILQIVSTMTEITIPIFIIVFLGVFIVLLALLAYAAIRGKFQKLDNKVDNLTNLVSKIIGWINAKDNAPFTANSPLALNEMGKRMAADMKADDIIEAHKDDLIKKVNADDINNAYDVQVACLNIPNETWEETLLAEELTTIKQSAYDNGFELGHYYKVLGLKLRDVILSMRNEGLSDVDKHDPADSPNSTN